MDDAAKRVAFATRDLLKFSDGLPFGKRFLCLAILASTVLLSPELALAASAGLQPSAYVKASNTAEEDYFGYAVAVSGNTMVVGAYEEDSNATGVNGDEANNSARDSGAVYVYVRENGEWTQQAYLKASNTDRGDSFGFSVAISGDTLIVGAPKEDSNATTVNGDQGNNSATHAGAVYVFQRSGTTWSQQAFLKAANAGPGDQFGYSLGISGPNIVVSAPFEDSDARGINGDGNNNARSGSGAAYVFSKSGENWVQDAFLKSSNSDEADAFGISVDISGRTVVVGSSREDSSATGVNGNAADNSMSYAGAAYVFEGGSGTWIEQAYLKASNSALNDEFGRSVAVSDDTVVVGAFGEDSNAEGINGDDSNNTKGESGAAYVFVRSGDQWSQQAYVKASNTGPGDQFGFAVDISGQTMVIGAWREASNDIGVDGNQSNNSSPFAGAAYVFGRSGNQWNQLHYLKSMNTDNGDYFGQHVAVSGPVVTVAANGEDNSATGINPSNIDEVAVESGAAYIFEAGGSSEPDTAIVGGSVQGLLGTGMVLMINGGNPLSVSTNGDFVFPNPQPLGSNYSVTVWLQPSGPDQNCQVSNGSGVVSGNVYDVMVSCDAEEYFVGGVVTGLVGTGLVLQNNGGDNLSISDDGSFVFAQPVIAGNTYSVSVVSQPSLPYQTCTVTGGLGTVFGPVNDVQVNCIPDTVNVVASDGMYPDKVRVHWEEAGSETYYVVYRCNDAGLQNCASLASPGAGVTSYDDLSAPPDGQAYFYTVIACNDAGCTDYAQPDPGNRLGFPTGVSASDASFPDHVLINWSDTVGESRFEVYRCAGTSQSSCGAVIAEVPADTTSYYDFDANSDGTTYQYRIKACNANGCSEFSGSDSGSAYDESADVIFSSDFE